MNDLRKVLSRILYGVFFGFAITLFVSCVLLIINTLQGSGHYNNIEAVHIDTESSSSLYRQVEEMSLFSGEIEEADDPDYGYRTLMGYDERNVYRQLEQSVYNISDEPDSNGKFTTSRITLSGVHLDEKMIRHALGAFLFDNPQVFWLSNMFGYAHSGDDTIIECYSVCSADDCSAMIDAFSSRIDELLSDLTPEMDVYDREKRIHDRLLDFCTYRDDVKGFSDGWEYFSAYGAIVKGNAVCEGYAKAMQILLNRAGIACCTVRGSADGIEHMWNLVHLDGKWYHLDPTWDDNSDSICYEYFNTDTVMITQNHTIAEVMSSSEENKDENAEKSESRNYFLPECTSRAMNYYTVEGYRFTGFSDVTDKAMTDFIVSRVQSGETLIPISMTPGVGYEECIDKMFYSTPYRFYHYVDEANERLDSGHKIDRNKIKILKNERFGTLRVRLQVGT